MMLFAHISQSFRDTFPARASEWALALMLFNWGVVLWLATDQQAYYAPMNVIMPQSSWAALCLLIGGARLLILLVNGLLRRSPHLRALTSFVSALVWFEISFGFLLPGAPSTGLAVYPVLFLLDTINTVRAMGDAGSSDRIISAKQQATPNEPPI